MKISGSYMQNGDKILYWKYRDGPYPVKNVTSSLPYDHHIKVQLAAQPAADLILLVNEKLVNFIGEPVLLNTWKPFVFFPSTLAAGIDKHLIIDAQMSGGRTFILSEEGAAKLHLPPYIYLDLNKLEWGDGMLQLRPEIKGAGTIFERTKLLRSKLGKIFKINPKLGKLYYEAIFNNDHPLILSSLAGYLNRNMGGQSVKLANHSVAASRVLLGKSSIKFIPSWMSISYSEIVMDNLRLISQALPKNTLLYEGISANEIRFTPSTIRALYFDNAKTDDELKLLASRVSIDHSELEETLINMIEDTRKYLELIVETTKVLENEKICWVKIGDIHEKFSKNDKGQYQEAMDYRKQRFSWVLAKDEVIVRKIGKFYTDMESYYGKDVGYVSDNIHDLFFHHELYILCVLRDHIRVCTKFRVALQLLKKTNITGSERKKTCQFIMKSMVNSINKNAHINIRLTESKVCINIKYKNLKMEHTYSIPREEIGEPY